MSATLPERELRALVDRLLLEQGRLDPLELLLASDLLSYADYEAWRLGGIRDLQTALAIPAAQAVELLDRAAAYARAQQLVATPVEHRGWAAGGGRLGIGADAALARACAASYAPPADRPQLDLFHDSSVLLLEEEIARALAERRWEQAREPLGRLMRQDPRHPRVRGFLRLLQAADEATPMRPEQRLCELEAIEPLARQLLGHRARDFLAPLWAALGEALAGRPFDPAAPRLHASFAWARVARWDAVRAAVEAEPGWPNEPLLVLAHAQACWRQRELASARRDWLGLCWEHPAQAERALAAPGFPDRRLAELWLAFADLDEALDTEDFPAWLLVAEPGTAAAVPPEAAPADERGETYRLLHALVRGGEELALRRALAERHPALLRQFLAQRR